MEEALKRFGEAVAQKMTLPSLFEFKHIESLFERENFDRLLLKTPLENQTEALWKLGLAVIVTIRYDSETLNEVSSEIDYRAELTKTLLFLMENADKHIILSVPRKSITVKNKLVIDLIRKCLQSAYKDFFKKEYVNMEELKSILEYSETSLSAITGKDKKGAPVKSYPIAYILQQILPLLSNQTTNENFRLIFDYCRFFNLIPDEIISDGCQYIKSVYRNYKYIMKIQKINWMNS